MGGRFITIEGGEGAGKTLLADNIARRLRRRLASERLLTTREPGGTPTADRIRGIFSSPPLEDPLLPETEAFLVLAARAQHVGRVIRAALEQGTWVLCDRFSDSTRVYQGALGGIDESLLEQMIALATGGLSPHLTFLLDCDVQTVLERLQGRNSDGWNGDGASRYDEASFEFHQKLRQSYLDLLTRFPGRMVRLDGTKAPEVLAKEALNVIEERLGYGDA